METVLKYKINRLNLKRVFTVCFILLFSIAFSQDPVIVFEGRTLSNSGKKLSGVSVKIFQNGKEVHSEITGSGGQYAPYEAYYGYSYKFVFSKEGFVSKSVEVDSKENFYEEDVELKVQFPINMTMVNKEPGIDYSPIENKPVARVHIDKNTGLIDFDLPYINSRKKEISDFFKKISDDAKNKDKKFTTLVKAGDKAFKSKNYESASL